MMTEENLYWETEIFFLMLTINQADIKSEHKWLSDIII